MPEVPVTSLDAREQKLVEKARVALQRGNYDYVEEASGAVLTAHPGCLAVRRLRHAARLQAATAKNRLMGRALGSLTQAGFLFGKKDPATQLTRADRILARDPLHPPGLRLLAEAAAEMDLPETAVFAWEALREVRPQDREIRIGLGRAYLVAGRAKEALAEADALLKESPLDGAALSLMREASVAQTMAQGNWEKEGSFREKLPDGARSISREQAAEAERLGQRRIQLLACVERYPNDPSARLDWANLLLEAGEPEAALAQFQQAQLGLKVRLAARAGMGHAWLARRMFDLALDQFQAVKAELGEMDDLKKNIIYHQATCLEAMGRTDEAMQELKLIYREDVGFRDVAARINAHYAVRG